MDKKPDVYSVSFERADNREAVSNHPIEEAEKIIPAPTNTERAVGRTALRRVNELYALDFATTEKENTANSERLLSLKSQVVGAMLASKATRFTPGNIMGIVKDCGERLDPDEFHELLVELIVREEVRAFPDGRFQVREHPAGSDDINIPPLNRRERMQSNLFSVAFPDQITQIMTRINWLPEVRAAREAAINRAKQKKRGKHRNGPRKRLQGKTHGKKIA